jgi:NADH-quinone oxidoreductase subunit K
MTALEWWLALSILLFCIGAFGVLMLNAVNIALVAIANFRSGSPGAGVMFALFIITLAAAEVAIGLAIVVANYRTHRTVQADSFSEMKG